MKKLLIISTLFLSALSYAQKEANFWYFGKNAGIDFSSGIPVALSNGKLDTKEGCSSISDENGSLLFYSDGIKVYTKNHELMKYSDGTLANNLQGNPSSTQSGLIIPNPEDKNIYYLFTVGTKLTGGNPNLPKNPGFHYYTIDISKGNGGEITEGPINLSNGNDLNWSEKVTAVQGSNCKEIWILSIVLKTFYAYKIDKNGVQSNTPVTSTISPYSIKDKRGYLKISPDGTKIALADFNASNDSGDGKLVLFDFDTTTGKVNSNGIQLTSPSIDGASYGVEFSQNSTKLYTSTYNGTNNGDNKVFQFNLTASDIPSSKYLIHSKKGFRGALQLAIDGKIYATVPTSYEEGATSLDAIENPNDKASTVIYTNNALQLNGKSTQGLPPFIQSFFAPVNLVDNTTSEVISDTKHTFCEGKHTIEPQENTPGATYTWYKDKTIIATTKSIVIGENNFGEGLYEVEIKAPSQCDKILTGSIEVKFEPIPDIKEITYSQCDFDNNPLDGYATFNLSSKESELIEDSNNIVIDFFETSDITFSNPLDKNSYINTIATNHQITARATNTITNCYKTSSITLTVNATPKLENYTDVHLCELDKNASNPDAQSSEGSGKGFYDFSLKTTKISEDSNNTLTTDTHIFQYYKTVEDASLQNNEILPPYENHLFTGGETVYLRISNKGINSCEKVGKFKIIISKLPVFKKDNTSIMLCIDNPKGVSQTQTATLNATTANNTDTYQWYFEGDLLPGATSSIYEANQAGKYKVEVYRTDTTPSNNCPSYNTFVVTESSKAFVVKIKRKDNKTYTADNSIEIIVSGIGDYEYALNSTHLTDFKKGSENLSFKFTNIKPGINKVYIRDRNGCGIVSTEEISILYIQKHFSPNEDGILDRWNILGLDNDYYEVISIDIFNRHGKLLKQITDRYDTGWNGTYNGENLPSNDYWYKAKLVDKNGKYRNKSGHFSLIRK